MKAKFFVEETREACEARAAEYFGCNKELLTFEVLSGEEPDAQMWKLIAIEGSHTAIENMDACYGIHYEPGGVYLELFKEHGTGKKLDGQLVIQHILRKNISDVSVGAVQNLMAEFQGRTKIAPEQKEFVCGEDITVEISENDLEAHARLTPPEPGGASLDLETAKKKLAAAGVVYGIDEIALAEMIETKEYVWSRLIAKATMPEDGLDGKVIFNFSKDERTGRPRETEAGKVDYRSLDLFEPVEAGQLLVTRELATEGKPGMTVKGKELKNKPGKEAVFPRGKNVEINEDKTLMRSMCSGMVQYQNHSVNVSNVYKINGDCDIGVGNIDFDGSVLISGSVRTGHTIKATGGVSIGGMLEAATIIAGGNVEVKGGMQGGGKGRIEAGGTVTALYIERGTVIADGEVNIDVSIHSTIETGGSLIAKGKRGAIIGGRTGAAGNVVASFIGAVSHTQTEVVVGVVLGKRERVQFLEKEIARLDGEIVKLDQLDAYLEKSKEKMDYETWDKLNRSGIENRKLNQESKEEFNAEMEGLKYELEHATDGKIHVFETVFPGSKIIIGSDIYKVNDEISFATFKFKDGKVVYGSCEISKPKD